MATITTQPQATNTNFIVFGLTWPGLALEASTLTITNYTTDTVIKSRSCFVFSHLPSVESRCWCILISVMFCRSVRPGGRFTIGRGCDPSWGCVVKDYKISICCFSAKHAALRRKSKDWLARNQNNVSEWSDMSTRGLLFQWASTIKILAPLNQDVDVF
jgi:hypothetical protein